MNDKVFWSVAFKTMTAKVSKLLLVQRLSLILLFTILATGCTAAPQDPKQAEQ